jgi:hypothetical protein
MRFGFACFPRRYRGRGIHVRNSLFLKPTLVERESHDLMLAASRLAPFGARRQRSCPSRSAVFILAHPPVAFPAPRRHVHRCGICSQCQQVAAARAGLLPLLPVIQPHPPPDCLRSAPAMPVRTFSSSGKRFHGSGEPPAHSHWQRQHLLAAGAEFVVVAMFKRAYSSPRPVSPTTMTSADFLPDCSGRISPGNGTLRRRW